MRAVGGMLSATFVACIKLTVFCGMAMADETNGHQFAAPCAAYAQLLTGKIVTDTAGCDPVEEFLVRYAPLSGPRFFSKLRESFKPASHFGVISAIGRGIYFSDDIKALEFLNAASGPIEGRLTEVGDPTRARFYKAVLTNLKGGYLKSLCSNNCDDVGSPEPFGSEILEASPALGEYDPRIVFECLARTDSYGVPIQEVVGSTRFLGCLGN